MAIEGKRKAPLRIFVISQQHYQNEVPYTVYRIGNLGDK